MKNNISVDELWDELRFICCAIKPHTEAKTIIQLHREDIAKAFNNILKRKKIEN